MLSQLTQHGRYILTLIGLLAVVVSFWMSVYFYTWEWATKFIDENTTPNPIEETKGIDFVGVFTGRETRPEYQQLQNSEVSNYNPRTPDTRKTLGDSLILQYFQYLNSAQYKEACSLLSLDQCNARRSIFGFSNFPESLKSGYEEVSAYKVADQGTEQIYCVKYQYYLKQDSNPNPIEETMQFRIRMRPDNLDEISARVCEAKKKWDKTPPCPIVPEKMYCVE